MMIKKEAYAKDKLNNSVDKVHGDDPIEKNIEDNAGFGNRSNVDKRTNPPISLKMCLHQIWKLKR